MRHPTHAAAASAARAVRHRRATAPPAARTGATKTPGRRRRGPLGQKHAVAALRRPLRGDRAPLPIATGGVGPVAEKPLCVRIAVGGGTAEPFHRFVGVTRHATTKIERGRVVQLAELGVFRIAALGSTPHQRGGAGTVLFDTAAILQQQRLPDHRTGVAGFDAAVEDGVRGGMVATLFGPVAVRTHRHARRLSRPMRHRQVAVGVDRISGRAAA